MPPHGAPPQHTSGSDSKQAFSAQELRRRSERDRHRSERDQHRTGGEHLFAWNVRTFPGERLFDPADPVENLLTTLWETLWKTSW